MTSPKIRYLRTNTVMRLGHRLFHAATIEADGEPVGYVAKTGNANRRRGIEATWTIWGLDGNRASDLEGTRELAVSNFVGRLRGGEGP